jgi:hypothetical protein
MVSNVIVSIEYFLFQCFFLCQAVWRRIVQLKLEQQYRVNMETRRFCQEVMALPVLPPHLIEPIMMELAAETTYIPLLMLLDYIQGVWVDGVWSPADWSVFRRGIRTNNEVEGWHRRLNSRARGWC